MAQVKVRGSILKALDWAKAPKAPAPKQPPMYTLIPARRDASKHPDITFRKGDDVEIIKVFKRKKDGKTRYKIFVPRTQWTGVVRPSVVKRIKSKKKVIAPDDGKYNDGFCKHCGGSAMEGQNYCWHCYTRLKAVDAFCPRCGKTFKQRQKKDLYCDDCNNLYHMMLKGVSV